jgi:hypothetical protein
MRATKTDLMRLINFLIYENKNLNNGISELKVKYKHIFEENQMLKIKKNRATQNYFKTKKLLLETQQLKAEKNELKVKLRNILNAK